ncbi:MAG TPA: DUF3795 domain-containing protein [Bacteroidales bacterium]|nr:DUF3795 domain-containing protein [Bacteroidales bacterium]
MKTNQLKEVPVNRNMIAYCGIYCGACKSYLKGKCPGCRENEKMSWCDVRKCNIENNFNTCADCTLQPLRECKKYNTFISKVIGIILNSDRTACIERIRAIGPDGFAAEMAEKKLQTIKRK